MVQGSQKTNDERARCRRERSGFTLPSRRAEIRIWSLRSLNAVHEVTSAMADIRSPRLLYFKVVLFLFLGVLSAGLLLAEHASWKFAALLALSIWSFARAYYFVFYVIQHYIDPEFKFSGLWAFAQYLLRQRRTEKKPGEGPMN